MKCFFVICILLTTWTIHASPLIDMGQLLKQFIAPFLVSHQGQITDFRRSPAKKSLRSLEAIIFKKIEDLKELLQDNDKSLEDEHQDETTIIEFYPKLSKHGLRTIKNNSKILEKSEPFKVDVEKYKKIKEKINNILAKDTLTDDGKQTITSAFDDIIDKLLKNQCTWKSVGENGKTRRSEEEVSEDAAMKSWKKQFEYLKTKYFKVLKLTEAPVSIEDLILIFESFNDFFSQIMNDINGMSKRYEIKCKLIDKKKKLQYSPVENKDFRSNIKNFKVQPLNDDADDADSCKNFKICSTEFAEFLTDFYTKLNETLIMAFKNYAAMYDRDVNTDNSEEGTKVTNIVSRIGDALEIKLEKIYRRKIVAITLDPKKDKQKNLKIINDFVKKVIESVNETIHKSLAKDFSKLPEKLQKSVTKDLSVHLDVELGNLERNIAEKICSMFEQCNSKSGRRHEGFTAENDNNLVFVNLKVNVTDEKLANAAKDFLRTNQIANVDNSMVDPDIDHSLIDTFVKRSHKEEVEKKSKAQVVVTRTTKLKRSHEYLRGTKMNSD